MAVKKERKTKHKVDLISSDPAHSPSFKSCMIRIPGTYNSKYPHGRNEIKVLQSDSDTSMMLRKKFAMP
jgi:hypothetical protein